MPNTATLPTPLPDTGQVPFAASRDPMPAFFGATGTGKTEQGAAKVLETCAETHCDALVFAPDYKMLRRATLKKYVDLGRAATIDPFHPYHESKQCMELRGGNTIWFATAETPENLWGVEVGIVHGDEICLVEPKAAEPADSETLKACLSRIRQPMPPGWTNQLIGTGTPKGIEHWTYKVWADPNRSAEQKARAPWWGMTIYENPYLSREYIRNQEIIFGTKSDYGRQELYGQWIVQSAGRIFQEDWFPRYDERPEIIATVTTWDTASTTKEWSAYTVGQVWGVTAEHHYYLLDMVREKMEYGYVKDAIRQAASEYKAAWSLIENKQSGQQALQDLVKEGVRVVACNPITDKQDRASQASIAAQEGRIHLPSEEYAQANGMAWLQAFTDEIFRVPYVLNWDSTDAMSQFIIWAEQRRYAAHKPRMLSATATYGSAPSRKRAFSYAR